MNAIALRQSGAPSGTYNVTNAVEPRTWAAYARRVFELIGRSADDVTPISTEEYVGGDTSPHRHLTTDTPETVDTHYVVLAAKLTAQVNIDEVAP